MRFFIQKRQQATLIFMLLLMTCSLVLTSCEQVKKTAEDTKEDLVNLAESEAAPTGVINKAAFEKYVKAFSGLSSDDKKIEAVFQPQKNVHFVLSEDQKEPFFKDLGKKVDSVKIRVSFGYDDSGNGKILPIVSLIYNTSTFCDNYYILEQKQGGNEMVEEGAEPPICDASKGWLNPNEKISKACANTLKQNWRGLAQNGTHYYLKSKFGKNSNGTDLIEFFTFSTEVSEFILGEKNSQATCDGYFELYYGAAVKNEKGQAYPIDNGHDPVPDGDLEICLVLQAKTCSSSNNFAAGGGDYYEFTKPCPTYCEPPNS